VRQTIPALPSDPHTTETARAFQPMPAFPWESHGVKTSSARQAEPDCHFDSYSVKTSYAGQAERESGFGSHVVKTSYAHQAEADSHFDSHSATASFQRQAEPGRPWDSATSETCSARQAKSECHLGSDTAETNSASSAECGPPCDSPSVGISLPRQPSGGRQPARLPAGAGPVPHPRHPDGSEDGHGDPRRFGVGVMDGGPGARPPLRQIGETRANHSLSADEKRWSPSMDGWDFGESGDAWSTPSQTSTATPSAGAWTYEDCTEPWTTPSQSGSQDGPLTCGQHSEARQRGSVTAAFARPHEGTARRDGGADFKGQRKGESPRDGSETASSARSHEEIRQWSGGPVFECRRSQDPLHAGKVTSLLAGSHDEIQRWARRPASGSTAASQDANLAFACATPPSPEGPYTGETGLACDTLHAADVAAGENYTAQVPADGKSHRAPVRTSPVSSWVDEGVVGVHAPASQQIDVQSGEYCKPSET
jgi:hypothetical protein